MRKTLKRNLSYDDRNHLYYVSLYYDGENGKQPAERGDHVGI